MVRTVSWSDSPFDTDEYVTLLICTTLPPRRSMAATNDDDVRVDGS